MMRSFTINVRGLSKKSKLKNLLWILRDLEVELAMLTEIKNFNQSLEYGIWRSYTSTLTGSGGAAIILDKNWKNVKLEARGENMVAISGNWRSEKFLVIAAYIPCGTVAAKVKVWEEIELIVKKKSCKNVLIGIDDNHSSELRSVQEKLEDIGVSWLSSSDNITYISPSGSKASLDRLYGKMDSLLSDSRIVPWAGSDHFGVLTDFVEVNKGSGYWKFNDSLLSHRFFDIIIKDCWNTINRRHQNAKTFEQLDLAWTEWKDSLQDSLNQLGRYARNEQREKVKWAKAVLEENRNNVLNAISFKDLSDAKETLRREEERIEEGAKTRAGTKWRLEGEKCTSFFLRLEREKQKENQFVFGGSHEEALNSTKEYYKTIFQSSKCDSTAGHDLLSFMPSLSSEHKRELGLGITKEELKTALGMMATKKAPGIDGFTATLWKKIWHLCEDLFFRLVKSAIEARKTPTSWRQGVMVLIPKGREKPNSPAEMRPITLLNSDYKIFATAAANRAKKLLDSVVNSSQQGFVKGRNLATNVLLVNLLLENVTGRDGAIICLDWSKAFDRISYEWLHRVLEKLEIPDYTHAMFSLTLHSFKLVMRNGSRLSEPIDRLNGVPQGCPLAPLLFLLAIEPLARMLNAKLEGIKWAEFGTPVKTALCADDTTIFAGCDNDLRTIDVGLKSFVKASGAVLNEKKCNAWLLGEWSKKVDFPFPVTPVNQPIRYLGVTMKQHGYVCPWETKKLEIGSRLKAWNKRPLSIKGRSIVAKYLLLSIIRYHIAISPVSDDDLKILEKLFFAYVWGNPTKDVCRNVCGDRVSRAIVSLTKEEGGLALPQPEVITKAAIIRTATCAMQKRNDETWARVLFEIMNSFKISDKVQNFHQPFFIKNIKTALKTVDSSLVDFLAHPLDPLIFTNAKLTNMICLNKFTIYKTKKESLGKQCHLLDKNTWTRLNKLPANVFSWIWKNIHRAYDHLSFDKCCCCSQLNINIKHILFDCPALLPWNIITPRKLSLTGLYELCSRPGFGSSKFPFAEVMLLFMWNRWKSFWLVKNGERISLESMKNEYRRTIETERNASFGNKKDLWNTFVGMTEERSQTNYWKN